MPVTLPVPVRSALPLLVALACAGCASTGSDGQAATKSPDSATAPTAEASLAAAEAAYAREDWATAEARLLDAARAARGDAEPWFKLGNVYYRTQRYDFAAQAYEQALRRAPGHARAWHNLGVVRLHQADASFERVTVATEPHDSTLDERAQRMRDILDGAIDPAPAAP